MMLTMRTLALAVLPMLAAAHSNVLVPRPRNAVDALTDPRFGSCSVGKGCAPLNDGTGHCAYGASCGCVCVNGTEPCNIGQTCFWYANQRPAFFVLQLGYQESRFCASAEPVHVCDYVLLQVQSRLHNRLPEVYGRQRSRAGRRLRQRHEGTRLRRTDPHV